MRLIARLFNKIIAYLVPRTVSRPEDIPKKLSPEALEIAMNEARKLRAGHAVDVKSLAEDELPGLPRRAD